MRPRGAVNPVGVLLGIGVLGAIYWAVIFGPLYLDNIGVKEAVAIGLTASRASEEVIAETVLRKINVGPEPVGFHFEEDDSGAMVKKPGLGLGPDTVFVVRDEATNTLRISVNYTRTVVLKPTTSVKTVSFHVEKEGTLSQ